MWYLQQRLKSKETQHGIPDLHQKSMSDLDVGHEVRYTFRVFSSLIFFKPASGMLMPQKTKLRALNFQPPFLTHG